MAKGIYRNKESELNKKFRMRNLGLLNKGRNHSKKTMEKIGETRIKRIKECKISRINDGCFKKGHISWNKGKRNCFSEKTKEMIRLGNSRPKPKVSETRKRLFKEGILKPSPTCWGKGHLPHGSGKTKENYEPLKKAGESISKTKNSIEWKEIKGKIASKKMSATKQGIELKDWKGFISFEPYDENWTNKLKRAIRKRDNQVCMMCGIHREKLLRALEVHHINYNKKMSIPQNCISLCIPCHRKTISNRKQWIKFFQSLLEEKYGYQYSEANEIIFKLNHRRYKKYG